MSRGMENLSEEDVAAALQLCSFQYIVLDPQSARELEEEKQRVQRSLPPPKPREKKTLHCFPSSSGNQPDDFPVALRRLVGKYCSPSWKKRLTESDLLDTQTRLLLKQSYVENKLYPLLTPEEVVQVKDGGLGVNVYDGEGNVYNMKFKLWGLKAYVLTNQNWLNFARDHNLVKGEDWITLWMFKHSRTGQVCFAIKTKPLSKVSVASRGKKVVRMDQCDSQKRSRNIASERNGDGCSN